MSSQLFSISSKLQCLIMAILSQVLFLNLKLRSFLRIVHGVSSDHSFNFLKTENISFSGMTKIILLLIFLLMLFRDQVSCCQWDSFSKQQLCFPF